MPILRFNADGDRPVPDRGGSLAAALSALPEEAPVVILTHGYTFSPQHSDRCPHRHILSLAPSKVRRAISWPRHLGFGSEDPAAGLCIAFGWEARGTIWKAHREAQRAGRALATLIREIRCNRRVSVGLVTHSLGGRVALEALRWLDSGSIGRAILISAAARQGEARTALETPAGRSAEIVNVTSRENAIFDVAYAALVGPFSCRDRMLGAGLGKTAPNWCDLKIDCPATRGHLAELGFRIPPPTRRICHWSGYLRPGLFPLYRAILRKPVDLPLVTLRPAST